MEKLRSVPHAFRKPQATLLLFALSLIGTILMLLYTSPLVTGPSGTLIVFVLLYLACFSLLVSIVHVVYHFKNRRQHEGEPPLLPSARLVTVVAAIAVAPIIFLALKSIGQLDVISVALVIVFEVLAAVYIFRR